MVPDDPTVAVALVFDRAATHWDRADLTDLRRLVDDEYFGADRRRVLDRIDELLGW